MNQTGQVIVTIDADGNVKVEAQHVNGPGCRRLTEEIEKAIGRTTADVKKPEFHRAERQSNVNTANQH